MRHRGKESAFRRHAGRLPPKCGCHAQKRDHPDRTAATRPRHAAGGKCRLRQKAISFRVRHARRTPARRSHRRPPRGGRIRRSRSEKRGSGKTQRQAHGKKLRHAALPRGEPPSEAATRTVLRTVCAPARAFSDERKDGAAAARKAIAAAFCAPQTPRSGVFPLLASPAPSAIIIPYFGENDKDSSKDFSQIAKFYPSFIFFS